MGKDNELGNGELKEMGKEERFMDIKNVEGSEVVKKKRGPKKKEKNEEIQNKDEQDKFFIDVSKEPENKEFIYKLLGEANNKTYGRKIILKDLLLASIAKLNAKDIEKLQENSLDEMEKVERALDEYNKKAETKLTLGEFLVKRLGIN
jgi:hypothetical protein